MYRALGLFHQGQDNKARRLAAETAARMKPLPPPGQLRPSSDTGLPDLLLGLAYKEAKAELGLERPPKEPVREIAPPPREQP